MGFTQPDGPGSPENFSQVATQGMNIQAPLDDLAAVAAAAVAVNGPRQDEARQVMESPAGYGDFDVTSGFAGGGGESWPNDVTPGG